MTGRLCLVAAGLAFLGSSAVHLATFTPLAATLDARWMWPLLAGGIAPLAVMVRRLRRTLPARRRWGRLALADWRPLVTALPRGLRHALLGALLYAALNTGLGWLALGETTAVREVDGAYYRMERAGAMAPATAEEHAAYRSVLLRIFSGQTLLLALIPLAYFAVIDPPDRPSGRSPRSA